MTSPTTPPPRPAPPGFYDRNPPGPPPGYYTVGDGEKLVNEPYFVTLTRIEQHLSSIKLVLWLLLAAILSGALGRIVASLLPTGGSP